MSRLNGLAMSFPKSSLFSAIQEMSVGGISCMDSIIAAQQCDCLRGINMGFVKITLECPSASISKEDIKTSTIAG